MAETVEIVYSCKVSVKKGNKSITFTVEDQHVEYETEFSVEELMKKLIQQINSVFTENNTVENDSNW